MRVLRLGVGDTVAVFDGRGREFLAKVAATTRRDVTVQLVSRIEPAAEATVALTLAPAVLKGEKMDDVVRDAVMMGVSAVQPIVTARSEVSLMAVARGHRLDRWARISVSSAKQCDRAVVPPVLAPMTLDSLLEALGRLTLPQPALMLVEPSAAGAVQSLADLDPTAPREATVIVGPEGGWTPEEVDRATAVCRLVRLGGRTLRADAMATVGIAALFARWGEY